MVSNGFRDCYEPATGRYCQSDPMGQAAGPSLYNYVESSPINWTDSLGLYVKVVVNGNNVTLLFPMIYQGPGASPQVINKFNNGIMQYWTGRFGKYKVKAKACKPDDCMIANVIDVPLGDGRAHGDVVGGNGGVWPADRPAWTAAHEAGHLADLPDMYDLDTGAPFPQYQSDIMGARDQRPSAEDIQNIINLNKGN